MVAGLVGDWAAAADVQLALPETGVCGVPAGIDANDLGLGSSCCGSAPAKAPAGLINFDLARLQLNAAPISLTPGTEGLIALDTIAVAEGSCCGVDSCCTDAAPVGADSCCTPETKQTVSAQRAQVGASSCCG